jgi:hypothetical protein
LIGYYKLSMPQRICVITYYGFKESLLSAANALRDQNHYVTEFPLFRYMHDRHDKVDNYLELLIDFIKKEKIDLVLWWFINISPEEFSKIKSETQVKYALFNWDDPFNWSDCQLAEKSQYLDYAFVTCSESLTRYVDAGCQNAHQLLPGFDPLIHHPDENITDADYEKYGCDVSFCCTNLYEDAARYPDQCYKRKEIIDQIYRAHLDGKFIFHLYGPKNIGDQYPEVYRGFVSYSESNLVFNCSKISLCTHVLGNMEGYLNERAILIGAAGGLLMVDPIKGIEKLLGSKIVIMCDEIVKQIENILTNYRLYAPRRSAIASHILQNYSYDQWAKQITAVIDI